MMLSPLDLLYITLSIFTAVIGTLLALVLVKTIRILWVIEEISSYYYSVKKALKAYEQIPEIVLEKIRQFSPQSKTTRGAKKSSQ